MVAMERVQGRLLSAEDLALVREWLREQPDWNRTRLSRELCRHWDWRNEKGAYKDMACRSLLLKLERRGLIRLPARQRPSMNGFRNRRALECAWDGVPIRGPLQRLRPLRIEPVGPRDPRHTQLRAFFQQHHYLGLRNPVGESLWYWVGDAEGRALGGLLFGSAAWKAQPRDRFIGWDRAVREQALRRLTNNHRFLILPWVEVPHLASHILGRVCRRLRADWLAKYGHRVEAVETFVERDRFRGSCYRAAGWTHVGSTTGRGRNGTQALAPLPVKDIYLVGLSRHWRGRLCA